MTSHWSDTEWCVTHKAPIYDCWNARKPNAEEFMLKEFVEKVNQTPCKTKAEEMNTMEDIVIKKAKTGYVVTRAANEIYACKGEKEVTHAVRMLMRDEAPTVDKQE